jgi:putative tricarboxylic transport membrane protein
MKRPYQLAGVVLILYSAFIARQAIDLRLYTRLGPGPGFFPLWVSILLALLGVIILFQASTTASDQLPEDFIPSRVGLLRVGAIITALAGGALLMEPLGFRLTMLGFLLFLLFVLGRENLLVTVLVALVGSFGTYYAFVELLKVQLPVGLVGI